MKICLIKSKNKSWNLTKYLQNDKLLRKKYYIIIYFSDKREIKFVI